MVRGGGYKLLSVLVLVLALSFGCTACSGGSDDDETTEQQQNSGQQTSEKITISASGTSAVIGGIVEVSVSFANFATNPEIVDVYVEGKADAIATGVAVSNGKITLDTAGYDAGNYSLYVQSGSVKSNVLSVTLTENGGNEQEQSYAYAAPTNVTVTASTAANTVTVKWTDSASSGVSYYWIYYSTENDTSALKSPNAKTSLRGSTGKEVVLTASGTYYFWVKAADAYTSDNTSDFSEVASYSFEYQTLAAPTDVTVTASASDASKVTVKWTGSDAGYYWIYYSTENDTSKLTSPAARTLLGGSYGKEVTLSSPGTYYFWVRAADDYSSDTSSDFSTAATYTYSD